TQRTRPVNKQFYLDLNHFARHTAWLHGFMSYYAVYVGVAILAFLVLVAWWRARSDRDPQEAVAAVLWVAFGTACAFLIAQPINHLVAEVRPYYALHHVELLVPKAHDFSFPSDHATVAGAVMTGLWMTRRDRGLAFVATVVGLFLAFARVYVGAHYPGDVIGGLVLGALVVIIISPIAMAILRFFTSLVDRTPLRPLVDAGGGWRPVRR
ncbi:MAG: phosphatase PAP2 family protein, partial [Acidimicrobiales bacterium]